MENSICPLPTGTHLCGDVADAGGRDVAVFAEGDLSRISKRGGTMLAPVQVCDARGIGVDEPTLFQVSLSRVCLHLEYMPGGSVTSKVSGVAPSCANVALLISGDLQDCMLITVALMPRCW